MADTLMDPAGEGRQSGEVSLYPGMGRRIDSAGDEVDLLLLWGAIWQRKLFIAAFTLLVTLVAVYVSLYVLTETYQSQAVLFQNSSDSGKLGGLASLADSLPIPISLPVGGEGGSQLLIFLQSRALKMKLIDKFDLLPRLYKEVWDPDKKTWTVEKPKDMPSAVLAIQQDRLKEVYQVAQDEKTQLITITWVDEEPAFAAEMLQRVIAELDNYLAHEYVSDAKRERVFVEKQLADATKLLEYWEQQVPSGELTLSKIKREELAAGTVYTELRKQLELARFTEAKEVINFKVIDPPFVPQDNFRPKRTFICALALVLGCGFALTVVLVQHWLSSHLQRRKSCPSVCG